MRKNILILAAATTLALTLAVFSATPRPAEAARNWSWWDAVSAQQGMSGCPANPPTLTDWQNKLGTDDVPHWTELTVYFIAYPCSGQPEEFLEFRDWLNYEVHDEGSWDSSWASQDFYELKDLVLELDQWPAGFFDDGPWG